ncbi:MAG TPA: hypothetical protein VGP25_10350 [Gemmatimonadaceae bacterium]|nr:hypothetical protein [Gemmatimonadaceae bacterium]
MSEDFERRVATALRAPVSVDARAKQKVMERVRRAAQQGHPRRRLDPWSRMTRHSIVGLAFAAGIGGISTLSAILPAARSDDSRGVSSVVLGDTVVGALHDTLRLVRLMFDAPSARQVAITGDFAPSSAQATPLERDADGRRWSVTLALRDGEHRYAFVVDDTRWVPDPRAERSARGADGRLYSLLNVARAAN